MKDLISLVLLTLLFVGPVAHAQKRVATGSVPPPVFKDPERKQKLAAAFPEIEKLFKASAERMPGAVMGVIVDGELVWVKAAGVREVSNTTTESNNGAANNKVLVTPETVFRIASMTKSFTAMAILKLRDEGKLSLDDAVARYVPALADLPYPTSDSPAITIRHLLTHSEGFPEDNPWGDRQLAQTNETIREWIKAGIPFSTAPGTAFEYSNYGFAILGQVVGYRREDNAWKPEPILAHGSFGAMGGLWTNAHDLARYVAFLMSAFPPRDEPERGPIKRSSAREMQQLWRFSPGAAFRSTTDAPLQLGVSGYGYGLGVSQDCRFPYVIGHGGGLPGYGSLMRWLPDYGVGLIAMGNLTYGGFGALFNDTVNALHRTGALQPRVVKPAPALLKAQADISQLIIKWDDAIANRITADNFFLDAAMETRKSRWQSLAQDHGTCRPATSIDPENALRGGWRMMCDRGWLDVFITLAPTTEPKVQAIGITPVLPPEAEMTKVADSIAKLIATWDQKGLEAIAAPGLNVEKVRRQISAASAWGSCKIGEPLSGNGTRNSAIRLTCDGGPLVARIALDQTTHKLTNLDLVPLREQRCVP
jgi:CubicO group peptidase (beta-lactamase class C family)